MTRSDQGLERTAKPSLLDRLVDLEPKQSSDGPISRESSISAYRASVLRDVEWLLNTRRTIVEVPEILQQVQSSVFAYGLPDLSSIGTDSPEARSGLVRRIERAIRLFEPRMTDVRVLIADAPDTGKQIRFTVEGMLRMEPNPERVVFDTVVELSRGDFSVDSRP